MPTLEKAGLVTPSTPLVDEVTPVAGKTLFVDKFVGNDATSALAACLLIWDYGGAGEEILWAINQGKDLPHEIRRTTDGVKKLAVVLDNACSQNYYMSAFCEYQLED